jgi:crotonobetainyl-CoA:carnitine CoA-transferase CaiB-like acyl-CoA transferase
LSESPAVLGGVKVVSFGAFVAGNVAARLLAEMGADVIKVEPRARPEVLRTPAYAIGDPAVEPSGVPNTAMYATLSRGMRSLSIDLTFEEARPVFHRLVAECDIVIENFGGPVLDQWGCTYEDLVQDNPRLIMLSLSGYGRTGPRAGYLGYASTICSFIGLTWAWGYSHGTLTDYLTAATGAVAAVAALGEARSNGTPAHLDIAQIDAMAPILAGLYGEPLNSGQDQPVPPNRVPGSWLSGVFPAQGHDAWLAVDVEDGADWNILCQFLGRDDLITADQRWAEEHDRELREALRAWAAGQTPHTAMHVLQKVGLAAAPVQSSEDIWRDPQRHVRGFGETVDQPDLGPVTYPTSAQRWTKAPGALRQPPPRLGQHTNEILRQWIRLSDRELESLAAVEAIFDAN